MDARQLIKDQQSMNVYQENGFATRADYLRNLADEIGVDLDAVQIAASLLGPSEDFDGLVTTLEDYYE
jgi:hypothetical protein